MSTIPTRASRRPCSTSWTGRCGSDSCRREKPEVCGPGGVHPATRLKEAAVWAARHSNTYFFDDKDVNIKPFKGAKHHRRVRRTVEVQA